MKAILICRGEQTAWVRRAFPSVTPYLLPVLNKPILEYTVELCALAGVREIRIVQDDPSPEVASVFREGGRWGVECTYLPCRPGDSVEAILAKNRAFHGGGPLLVAEGLFFPRCDMRDAPSLRAGFARPESFSVSSPSRGGRILCLWPGAGPGSCREEETLPFLSLDDIQGVEDYYRVSMETIRERSHQYVLPGYTNEEGVWIGANVEIPPNARLRKPLMIGDHVRLIKRAGVGPLAVVGRHVIVDDGTVVRKSIVFDHAYLGPGLEFDGKIVFGNRVLSPSGEYAEIDEKHLVAPLERRYFQRLLRAAVHRILALLLILLQTLPYVMIHILLAFSPTVFRRRPECLVSRSGKTIRLTRMEDGAPSPGLAYRLYRRFSLDKFPLLFRIFRGELQLAGQTIREKNAANLAFVADLPAYEPAVFAYAESLGAFSGGGFDAAIHDRYYAAAAGIGGDLRIVCLSLLHRMLS